MNVKDSKQIFFNLMWAIIGGALSYIVNFLLTPYITNRIGIEAFGFISLGNTIISYINIISVGINSFAARFIAVHYHNEEIEEANKIYSSVLIANMVLSSIVVISAIPVIRNLEQFIVIPKNIVIQVKILFVFVVLNYLVNLFVGVTSSVAFINNKTGITSRIKASTSIIYAVLIVSLFSLFGVKVYYIGVANFIVTVIGLIITCYFSIRIDSRVRFSFNNWSIKSIKEVLSAGIFNSINSLGGTLGSGLDLLITNKYLSTIIMGQIAIGNQLGTLVTTAISLVAGVFQPKQLEAYSKGDRDSLVKQLCFSMKACGYFGALFLVVFLAFGKSFLSLWIPGQDIQMIYMITCIILAGDAIVAITTPLYYVMTLTLKMKVVCFITILCGLANVTAMIICIRNGIGVGQFVVVGTTAVLDLVALIVFPKLSQTYLKLDRNPFTTTIYRYFCFTIILGVICCLIDNYILVTNWRQLFILVCIFGLFLSGIFFVMILDLNERKRILSLLTRE